MPSFQYVKAHLRRKAAKRSRIESMDPADDAALSHATRMINTVLLLFLVLGAWAYFSPLDEVSKGDGKVIPSSHEQIIQSLEGGILAELKVAEGDLVEVGQVLPNWTRPRPNPMSRKVQRATVRCWPVPRACRQKSVVQH